jgi:putative glycosyltransferase (TIGR04348 family)
MRVILVTPAPPRSRSGNRTTAARWAHLLRDLGHRVTIAVEYGGEPFDLMVALHAWRSADAIAAFAERWPDRPRVLALTGTDLYRFIHSHPEPSLRSVALADRLVTLHALAYRELPPEHRARVRVIYQSARALPRRLPAPGRRFEVVVACHLREEKDPLRAAYAVREVPPASRLFVAHYGGAHTADWAEAARAEAAVNHRFRWFGEVPYWRVRQAYARARLMVISSRMEGGANVVSEAIVAGLPVVGSDIPGNVGLLGEDYPGYYPVEDSEALRVLLLKCEADPDFYRSLEAACTERAPLFTPAREREAWRALLRELA